MRKTVILLALVATVCSACTVSEVITAEKTELDVASLNISENMLLDIGVVQFEPGIPKKNEPEKTGIYPELREAESRFLPYHIKTTLQSTGFWGAVRVVPSREVFSDVILSGLIKRSDGEHFSLQVKAEDITGREWFERTYEAQTGIRSYAGNRDRTQDPYQKAFNDLANDLRDYAAALTPKEIATIRQTSELMFFADMAPTVFGEHLSTDKNGMVSLQRLPAENDPMVDRLRLNR
jgi:hypothetical protein